MFIAKKPQKRNPVFLIFQDNSLRKNYINVKIDNKKMAKCGSSRMRCEYIISTYCQMNTIIDMTGLVMESTENCARNYIFTIQIIGIYTNEKLLATMN